MPIGPDPHLSVAHFDWAGRHVIRPEIERAATRKVEPGMVPMAGQNAVLHAPAIKGEPHMRTSVVKGEDATLITDNQDGSMRTPNEEPPFGVEVRERACTHELGLHDRALLSQKSRGKITSFGHVMNQTIRSADRTQRARGMQTGLPRASPKALAG